MKPFTVQMVCVNRYLVIRFLLLVLCVLLPVSGGWKQIGFAGKKIQVLTVGNDIMHDRRAIFTSVNDSGVFMFSGAEGSIYPYGFNGQPDDRPMGEALSLCVKPSGEQVYVGTDSGFFAASLLFSSLPLWRKVSPLLTAPVYGIARTDSVVCAVTATGIYRSKGVFGTWVPCSTVSEPVRPGDGTVFSSITSWPFGYGFMVGSSSTGGQGAGVGEVFGSSSMHALLWSDTACIPECTCLNDDAYSLEVDSIAGRIYAGTPHGIFHSVDFDTGCWHPHNPQLEMPVYDMCFVQSEAFPVPPEVYAATDSGVYLQSFTTSASGAWRKLSDRRTYAVEVMGTGNRSLIYAATDDGVWKFDPTTGVVRPAVRRSLQSVSGGNVAYSLDGRVLENRSRKRYRGVCIIKRGEEILCGISDMRR